MDEIILTWKRFEKFTDDVIIAMCRASMFKLTVMESRSALVRPTGLESRYPVATDTR